MADQDGRTSEMNSGISSFIQILDDVSEKVGSAPGYAVRQMLARALFLLTAQIGREISDELLMTPFHVFHF